MVPMETDPAVDGEAAASQSSKRPSLSAVIAEIGMVDEGRVTLGRIVDTLGDRAYGALMLLFAAPNILPTPPGFSAILGAPLVLLAAQLAFGSERPWFPDWVRERSVARVDYIRVAARLIPILQRSEKLLRPRLPFLTNWTAERLIGVLCLVLSISILLPIPLGNSVPALGVTVLSLAIMEKDGIAAILGVLVGIAGLALSATVVWVMVKAALLFFHAFIVQG